MTFSTILIANRGEIACRIIRTAHALGYRTVAVYSDADAGAPHVGLADRAVRIGPPPVRESYLNVAALIAAAKQAGADAVHPGYGFLSENDGFAQAVLDAGLVFIGPSPAAIRAMGNKAAAKRAMIAAGVPCIPGFQDSSEAGQSAGRLAAEAERIGLPLLIKAAAGGGGRGMRMVRDWDGLPAALASARSEAESAFGSGELILERAITSGRHVEIQVFGDSHGHAIHLGERDCSVQRRHQKVVEESPSPAVSPALRAEMGAAAVLAARSIDYVGAGTVEFMLDADGKFYFLEMNTRLQVEHPVTELVTGLDLVAWQLRVAAGEPLPLTQEQIELRGHAIEVRLYAEDPYAGYLPQAGEVVAWQPASGDGVRVDHGLHRQQTVSPFYDPMIAKVITYGRTRDEARRRLVSALGRSVLLGLPNNKRFLADILEHPVFAAGGATTRFLDEHLPAPARPEPDARAWAIAATIWTLGHVRGDYSPWRSAGRAAFPWPFGQVSASASWRSTSTRAASPQSRSTASPCPCACSAATAWSTASSSATCRRPSTPPWSASACSSRRAACKPSSSSRRRRAPRPRPTSAATATCSRPPAAASSRSTSRSATASAAARPSSPSRR
ncbi:acetyl-CoA carboxylase biotin carboxylase subunit [Nannocystis pusilla]|uniref:acetyl-CoA carboxylase biotin carboxylase subunit n=1 Tax=Nannocystis pusilla TaxID=889268 RepID=UPI003B796DB8